MFILISLNNVDIKIHFLIHILQATSERSYCKLTAKKTLLLNYEYKIYGINNVKKKSARNKVSC